MSSDHLACLSTGSTERPISLTPRLSNSGFSLASAPSSVVQTGVKSLGCENSSAQLLPIQSWNLIFPSGSRLRSPERQHQSVTSCFDLLLLKRDSFWRTQRRDLVANRHRCSSANCATAPCSVARRPSFAKGRKRVERYLQKVSAVVFGGRQASCCDIDLQSGQNELWHRQTCVACAAKGNELCLPMRLGKGNVPGTLVSYGAFPGGWGHVGQLFGGR